MGFKDEIKKIIHPYDDEDYDYEEEFEEPEKVLGTIISRTQRIVVPALSTRTRTLYVGGR